MSIRSGTAMHGSRRPLRDWLFVMCGCCRHKAWSVRKMASELGVRYHTAFDLAHKVRSSLDQLPKGRLEGDGLYVGLGLFHPYKIAKGDPRRFVNVLVAIAAKATETGDAAADFRMVPLGSAPQEAAFEKAIREAHLVDGAAPVIELRAPYLNVINLPVRPITGPYGSLLSWTQSRFGGVSRRYLTNYVSQFAYVLTRQESLGDALLDHFVRRTFTRGHREERAMALPPLCAAA